MKKALFVLFFAAVVFVGCQKQEAPVAPAAPVAPEATQSPTATQTATQTPTEAAPAQ